MLYTAVEHDYGFEDADSAADLNDWQFVWLHLQAQDSFRERHEAMAGDGDGGGSSAGGHHGSNTNHERLH